MRRIGIILTLLFSISSCKIEHTYTVRCGEYFGEGKLENATYKSCDGTETNYDYKIGRWEYYDKQGNLLAKTKYAPRENLVIVDDTCKYNKYMSMWDINNWKFWGVLDENPNAQEGFIIEMTLCDPEKIDVQ